MASSRALMLLQREQTRMFRGIQPWGIKAAPMLNDPFHWRATILGPPDTPWEGGIFKVDLHFDENFDEMPPRVIFATVPFHPNVELSTGRPCTRLLDDPDAWRPGITIPALLCSIQFLLANPDIDEAPVNPPAAEIYASSRRLYDQLARDCVVASRRLDAGLEPHELTEPNIPSTLVESKYGRKSQIVPMPEMVRPPDPPKVSKLAFDDYFSFWKTVATSMPLDPNLNAGYIVFEGQSTRAKLSEDQFRDLVEKQSAIWYGRFEAPKKKPATRKSVKRNVAVPVPSYAAGTDSDLGSTTGGGLNINAPSELLPKLPSVPDGGGDQKMRAHHKRRTSTPGLGGETVSMSASLGELFQYDVDGDGDGLDGEADWENEARELENWAETLTITN
ncbi:Ubiquitin-conjugating enzyme E2 U [Irineochytrium annulatum]|nr:Ubiquitin-conjugating enzyme E2 U [Irineochytrium annulatum]